MVFSVIKSIMAHDHFVEVLSFPGILSHWRCVTLKMDVKLFQFQINIIKKMHFCLNLHLHADMKEKCIKLCFRINFAGLHLSLD